jgi:hypothetical protein
MFKRLVLTALAAQRLRLEDVALATDDGLIHELQREDVTGLAHALRERRLAKRALDIPATELPSDTAAWPASDPELCLRVEDRLARELGLGAGELFLDFPGKRDMLALDLPLVKRDGSVTQVAGELYRSARRLRVFVLRPVPVPMRAIVDLIMLPGEEVAARLAAERSLVSSARG